jgi:hypothetical protein
MADQQLTVVGPRESIQLGQTHDVAPDVLAPVLIEFFGA